MSLLLSPWRHQPEHFLRERWVVRLPRRQPDNARPHNPRQDSPECREIVRHGVNGLLVRAANAESLAAAIAHLINDAPLRAAMGVRGREVVVREYSSGQVLAANFAVYLSLLVSIMAPSTLPMSFD
jgi:Glycosyl transferases group 1